MVTKARSESLATNSRTIAHDHLAGSHQAGGFILPTRRMRTPLTEKACTLFGGPNERFNLPAGINERLS